ncbi:MAG: hypothetical protein NC938_05700 [Candidatus Omnitrophica bacterium]|nr:hypothetical protein [Candidatus Omnitrophota bacterium]MCM8791172.1 hypothetical protein [Candidatus Omnitrophota bacterium]
MKTINLPFNVKAPILATGADLKGAFALAKGNKAHLVEGFGDLSQLGNLARYEDAVIQAEKRLSIRPRVIACDHHPDYCSTRFAEMHGLERMVYELIDIQHHEAHAASAIVDNNIKGGVIAVVFDGTGFGWDGCIWGGEFLVGSPAKFRRAGHFEYIPMAGGEAVIKEPWRMAATHLYGAFGDRFLDLDIDFVRKVDRRKWRIVKRMIDSSLNAPLTSSVGRLFDAVASIILCKFKSAYEAELPMELEKIAIRGRFDHYQLNVRSEGDRMLVGYKKIIEGVIDDLAKGIGRSTVSAKFHNTIAQIIAEVASRIRKRTDKDKVVLSGGVFQNKYLTAKTVNVLRSKGFSVFTHSRTSANDSGIPIGQIAIAHSRYRGR